MAQNLPSNASQMLTEEALQYMESMQLRFSALTCAITLTRSSILALTITTILPTEITEAVDSLVELGKKAEEITPEQQAALHALLRQIFTGSYNPFRKTETIHCKRCLL